jgi:nucleoside-diphosphate-sugar epimerase
MKVTILGSSGQVGAYLTEYLRNKGHEVTEYDQVLGPQYNLTAIPSTFLESTIKNSDFVFFLAFDVGGSRYLQKYQHTYEFINNNTRLMANAFDQLHRYNVPFLFASSQMSNMSYSPYGVMKRVGELYTEAMKGLIVHFWNVYGIEHDPEKSHVITDFISKGFESDTVQMLTDGTESRQFLYAEDCCEALEIIMLNYHDLKTQDKLHVTTHNYDTINEVASVITDCFKSIGKDVKYQPADTVDSVQLDKKNEADPYILDWWKPKTSLREGIEKVFTEMKNARI